jgi:cytochrome c peroxidase
MRILFIISLIVCLIIACKKEHIHSYATPFVLETPSHFPEMIIPEDNPFTVEGIALGRKLFYETKLSGNNTQSCASCHSQEAVFSDTNQFSTGIDGIQGNRNSSALLNLGWQSSFFWDGRAKTLEEQILGPVPNPIEMHQNWEDAVQKLQQIPSYRSDFYKAFGTTTIDSILVSKAIAQFLRTLISASSKYDIMYKYENNLPLSAQEQAVFPSITTEEWAGYDLFKSLNGADCFHCHNGPLMQVAKFSNNGLDNTFEDLGRGAITKNPTDNGKFKVPTLRNIALSAPYMHDGRFTTLDEVIEHYSSGIHQSATLDPLIEFSFQGGVQLDAQQKQLLKAFLHTLTDLEFVNNPKYSKP